VIAASGRIDAAPEDVFAALDDLAGHWRLLDRWTEIVDVAPDGRSATVRLRGPLGLRRTARTRVLASDPPRGLEGEARVGRGTVGRVRWTLTADGGGTLVDLQAEVVAAGGLDRVLLALGASRWLRARFADALARLATGRVVAAA
jgi:uncharacterized protein YndB with AHSA1/START domain